MINEKQLVEAAEAAAGSAVLESLEARRQLPGEIVSQRGLLAATHNALVFVVDDLLRAGPATVWRRQALRGYQQKDELFVATLTLQVGETEVRLGDLQPERLTKLLVACGLTSPTAAPSTPAVSTLHSTPPTAPTETPMSWASPLESKAPPAATEWSFSAKSMPLNPDEEEIKSQNLAEDDSGDDEDDDEAEDDDDDDNDDVADDVRDDANQQKQETGKPVSVEPEKPPAHEKVKTPIKSSPEAVSELLGLGMMMLLVAAIAVPVLVGSDLRQSVLGIQIDLILGSIGQWGGQLSFAFFAATAVTVVGAPAVTLGCRPTVFWTTLPMFFALFAALLAVQSVFPDPKHLPTAASSATELLTRLRHAQAAPLLAVVLGAYVYGLPLLGAWFRALATHPRHRKADRQDSVVEPGDSRTPLLMIGSALLIPFVSCLYVQRASHAPWAIVIALLFISPSALLLWQGSRLDARLRWELGGSPAAFMIQGAVVYFLYWILVRQMGVLPHIDEALALDDHALASGAALDSLQRVIGHYDLALLKGLALSHLGLMYAARIGHLGIVRIDESQGRSGAGWLLSIALLLILAMMAWAAEGEASVRIPAFIEQVKEAARHVAPNG